MRYFLGAAALLALSANAQSSDGCTDDGGNNYCKLVDAISYQSVGGSGSYNKVTNMDSNSGSCSSTPYGYSGNLSPMNEEISIHIRGPTILKRFAAYTPGSASSSKKKRDAQEPERRHAHGHTHQHLHKRHQERDVGDIVVATINGAVQSWTNAYDGGASSPATSAALPAYSAPAASSAHASGSSSSSSSESSDSSDGSDDSSDSSVINDAGPGSWGRHGFYDGDDGTNEGLVFLNHNGGSGSGTFDYKFGNSLSYASADGCQGAGSAQTLAKDTLLPSSGEIVIMTDDKCDGDDCGYTRPDTVAYHGFDGDDKAFFFEFQMPDSGEQAASQYDPVNMPAIWSLNAQIPRTLQYGNEDCSCWQSGCGEFDIFEVLAPGDSRMKSTMHGNKAGGSSDYFDRPVNGAVKGAMIMMNNQIHVKMLPNDTSFDFPTTMDKADLNSILTGASTNGLGNALFNLADAISG